VGHWEELIPASVRESLAAVAGLQRGRSKVRETPVEPVAEDRVKATRPTYRRLSPQWFKCNFSPECAPAKCAGFARAKSTDPARYGYTGRWSGQVGTAGGVASAGKKGGTKVWYWFDPAAPWPKNAPFVKPFELRPLEDLL
jgi:hypothetical protein